MHISHIWWTGPANAPIAEAGYENANAVHPCSKAEITCDGCSLHSKALSGTMVRHRLAISALRFRAALRRSTGAATDSSVKYFCHNHLAYALIIRITSSDGNAAARVNIIIDQACSISVHVTIFLRGPLVFPAVHLGGPRHGLIHRSLSNSISTFVLTCPFPFTKVHPPANLNLAVRSEETDINLIMIAATLLLVEVEWKVWQMEIFQSTNS